MPLVDQRPGMELMSDNQREVRKDTSADTARPTPADSCTRAPPNPFPYSTENHGRACRAGLFRSSTSHIGDRNSHEPARPVDNPGVEFPFSSES